MRRIAVLGSTGSIGHQALEVIESSPHLEVAGLVAGRDEDALREQAARFGTSRVGLGEDAAIDLARADDVDVVLNAIVGAVGLRASLGALEAGKVLALANKESLVAGGELCRAAAARGGGTIVPVDSEHAAVAQCLEGRARGEVARLILTASGGPFLSRHDLADVTVAEALAHPTWSMGPKITIDSATLMNKGLEVIEAHHLFGFSFDQIDVVVHPQSAVHGAIELVDGTLVLQAGPTDMKIPIRAALTSPERVGPSSASLDLARAGTWTFQEPDLDRFPAISLAYAAGREGGSFPAVLNAANEEAVGAFLDSKIPFTSITDVVARVLDVHEGRAADSLEAVLDADAEARAAARRFIQETTNKEMVGT